jgi:hypothetical protein
MASDRRTSLRFIPTAQISSDAPFGPVKFDLGFSIAVNMHMRRFMIIDKDHNPESA